MVDLAVPTAAARDRRLASPNVAVERDLPAWPVTAMLAGYPLWWALGLTLFVPLLLALVMTGLMLLRRRVRVVPGVLPWLAFCLWVLPSALMIDTGSRLLIYGIRTAQFFAVAVVLVYVVNAGRTYPPRRAIIDATVLWASVVVLGLLALVLPEARLLTLPGMVLPPGLAADEFLRDIFFPPLAEIQTPWGAPQPFVRPAAPFPYTNNWGGAIAVLTPLALAGVAVVRRTSAVVGIGLLLVISLIPVGASSNRGMFLGLAVGLGYVAVRLALRGHLVPFIGLGVVGLAGLSYYLFGGAAESIAERQTYSNTTEGRGTLYVETFRRTMESPIIGWGGPRPSGTVEVSVGTQGWIWQLMFSFGFVGLALFLYFLLGMLWRTRRAQGTTRLLMHASMVTMTVLTGFYGLHLVLLLLMASIGGVLLRERVDVVRIRGRSWGRPSLDAR
jgi:polysaccharide biosynthesis protein PslJ